MIILNNNDNKSIFNLLLIFLHHDKCLSRALCNTVDLKYISNGGTAIVH